ncbi:hypothetical protein [Catellatospora paridis]|uniref:hypothetical protein n=1 Tax=Catellatospora paridis TaxID=1617086 RepID=UPI0012D3ECBC|nr:hypothetical protein [Catellatospora paridis]
MINEFISWWNVDRAAAVVAVVAAAVALRQARLSGDAARSAREQAESARRQVELLQLEDLREEERDKRALTPELDLKRVWSSAPKLELRLDGPLSLTTLRVRLRAATTGGPIPVTFENGEFELDLGLTKLQQVHELALKVTGKHEGASLVLDCICENDHGDWMVSRPFEIPRPARVHSPVTRRLKAGYRTFGVDDK